MFLTNLDLLQKSFSSIHGTGSPAHPTRKNKSCGMAGEPVLNIFARGLLINEKLVKSLIKQLGNLFKELCEYVRAVSHCLQCERHARC